MDEDEDDAGFDPFEQEPPGFWRRHGALTAAWLVLAGGLGGLVAWLAAAPLAIPPPQRIALAPAPPATPTRPGPPVVSAAAQPTAGADRGPDPAATREAPDNAAPGPADRPDEPVPAERVAAPGPTSPAETPAAGPPDPTPPAVPPAEPERRVALAPVPDPALVDQTPVGPLPIVGTDGRRPWRVYARPFTADPGLPRIAVVVGGLGFSRSATSAAVQRLQGPVTLAFAPYAQNQQTWITEARAAGHEVMLQLPMEPFDYPNNDPGPHTLLTSLGEKENIARLEWLLGRFAGYVGVTNLMGAKFTTSASHLEPVMLALKERGLMFLDARVTSKSVAARVARKLEVPRALNNRFIDAVASRAAIDARLDELERIAQLTGSAVGIGYAYPVTIERLANWTPTLRLKGIALAPVSALANRQKAP